MYPNYPIEHKEKILREMDCFLRETFHYQNSGLSFGLPNRKGFSVITSCRSKYQLYIRFAKDYSKQNEQDIVLAQFFLKATRKGLGTKLLVFLYKLAQKYRYDNIAIESTNNNSKAFALAFSFQESLHTGTYIIPISKLRLELIKRNLIKS